MKFRNRFDYFGEFYLALTIPADENKDVIPCACKVNADGSYRLVYDILYSLRDIRFARELARGILADHPGWSAGLYRDGAMVAEVRS
jgi:hypothetical protein